MSRDPQDPGPRRRPRPREEPADSYEIDDLAPDPTTFLPNPKRVPAPAPRPSGPQKAAHLPASRVLPRDVPSAAPEPATGGPSWWERILFGRVGSGQLARFCHQFAAYLDAGVNIQKTLSSLEQQFARTALGPVIGRLMVGVRHGDSLAALVEREPQAFDKLFLGMIKVAEARGGIPETLQRLARHYEARQSLIRQARSAMIYPIAVLVVASAAVALITIYLLPMFMGLLRELASGTRLPLPSRILMGFSDFMGKLGWWLLPVLMIGIPLLGSRFYKTAAGKRIIDEMVLYVPVFGLLLRKIDTTRFARTLSTLLGAGVDVGSSLDLTADVLQLDPYQRAIRKIRGEIIQGGTLSDALQESKRFGPDVIAIVESGEETGKLPESLEHLADDYEEQVAYMVKNMGQLIQPILMVLMGGLVLFIILAVLLPYISVLSNLAGGS